MDFTTHLTSGAFLATALAKGRPSAAALGAAFFVGALAPDVDTALYVYNPQLYFQHHRVPSHHFVGAAALSLAVAALVHLFARDADFWVLFAYALWGAFFHLFLDTLTGYPLQLLLPFSTGNHALRLMSWHDPFIKSISLIGLGVSIALPAVHARWAGIAGIALFIGYAAQRYVSLHRF